MEEFYNYYPGFDPGDFYYETPIVTTGVYDVSWLLNILFIALLFSIVKYVFESFAIYAIAKARGMDNTFFAFVPALNTYYLGKVSDDIGNTMNKKTNYAVKLLFFSVISSNLLAISYVFFVLFAGLEALVSMLFSVFVIFVAYAFLITYLVYRFIALYKIFKEYSPTNATLFLVFSIMFDISAFFLFAIRNNKSGYQLWQEEKTRREEKTENEPVFMDGYSNPDPAPASASAPETESEPETEPETIESSETEQPQSTETEQPSETSDAQ